MVIIGVCLVLGVSGISADDSLLVVKLPCRLNESFFPVISRKYPECPDLLSIGVTNSQALLCCGHLGYLCLAADKLYHI